MFVEISFRRALRVRQARGPTATSTLADMQEKRNTLARRIELWQTLQDAHMPLVAQIRGSGNLTSSSSAGDAAVPSSAQTRLPTPPPSQTPVAASSQSSGIEDARLWLPSALTPSLRTAAVSPGLFDKERRLRIAQADDALEDLRRCRRILTGVNEFRRYNVDGLGQRTEGKVRTVYSNFKDKQQRAAERYCAARAALASLDPDGNWTTRLKVLNATDIRGPGHDDNTTLGEGYYEISWIWLVPHESSLPITSPGDTLDRNEFLENMRVEWVRSKARAERWGEEIQLLEEEMRRVITYLEWMASWWREQGSRWVSQPAALERGLKVYAERQARVYEGLACRFAVLWVPYFRTHRGGVPEWAASYKVPLRNGTAGLAAEDVEGLWSDSDSEGQSDVDLGSSVAGSSSAVVGVGNAM